MIVVGIPTYKGARRLDWLLTSIRRWTEGEYDLLVLDDGSPNRHETWNVAERHGVPLIQHKTNEGIAASWNDLATYYDADIVALLNDDIIVQPDWLKALTYFLDHNSKVGACSLPFYFITYPDVPNIMAGKPVTPRDPFTKAPKPELREQTREEMTPGRIMCLPPSEEVICNPSVKAIGDVHVGDDILSHLGRFRKVTNIYGRHYEGPLFKIHPRKLNFPFKVTGEHPVLAVKGAFCWWIEGLCKPSSMSRHCSSCNRKFHQDYKLEWVQAQDLTENHMLAYPLISHVKDVEMITISDYWQPRRKPQLPANMGWRLENDCFVLKGRMKVQDRIKVNRDFMEFAGFYVAEGDVSFLKGGTVRLSLHKKEQDMAQRLKYLIKKVFNLEASIHPDRNRETLTIRLYSLPVANLLKALFGTNARNKHVPKWFLMLPLEKQIVFTKALFMGDGNIYGQQQIYDTASSTLAFQVYHILLRLGQIPYLAHDQYEGRWDIFHFVINEKPSIGYIWEKYLILPIKSIQTEYYSGKVINLKVEGDNSFCTLGATLHNCAAGSVFAFKRRTYDMVGGFDDMDFKSFFEESDFGTSLAKEGYPSYGLTYPHCYHLWSATFAESPELRPQETLERSMAAYIRKWEVPPEYAARPFDYTNPKYMSGIPRQRIRWLGSNRKEYEEWDIR